jgi:homoserine kinase type II
MAVYTAIDDASLNAFLAAYEIGQAVDLQGITEGVENSNYLLLTARGRFILTLYERRVDPADLPFFLGLMDHLAARGVPCPTPVHARDGAALHNLRGRPAAVVSFLDGTSPRRVQAGHCAALGKALGQLHLAGVSFPMTRPNARELAAIEREWPEDLARGIIHADLFPDNVFFEGDRLTGIIDFYFACNDIIAYDLAICLNAWCFEADGAFNITKARQMLAAYRAERPFTPRELDVLPLLARGAALRFLLTRLFDWQNRVDGALVKPKDPLEYFDKLRFHRGVSGPGAYGLD